MPTLPAGIRYLPDYFNRDAQAALVEDIRRIVRGGAAVHAGHAARPARR